MQQAEKKLLILDVDETLIHGTEEKLERETDFNVGRYYIYKRPHLESFLNFCFENFEVAVWTTATKSYAEVILNTVLTSEQKLRFLWSRERCTIVYDEESQTQFYVKRMYKLRRVGYDLGAVIIVDDSPNVWKCSYGNLIRVSKFEGDMADDELRILPVYLEKLKEAENIRSIEKRGWRNRI